VGTGRRAVCHTLFPCSRPFPPSPFTPMMAATAVSHGLRSLSRGETGKAWLILKCCVAVVCAPLGVFMELHAFDKVSLVLYGIATFLWLCGWLPGKKRGVAARGLVAIWGLWARIGLPHARL